MICGRWPSGQSLAASRTATSSISVRPSTSAASRSSSGWRWGTFPPPPAGCGTRPSRNSISLAELRLQDVRFEALRLLDGDGEVRAGAGQAAVTVTDADLSRYLADQGLPLDVRFTAR